MLLQGAISRATRKIPLTVGLLKEYYRLNFWTNGLRNA